MNTFGASRFTACALALIVGFNSTDASAKQAAVSSAPELPPTALLSEIEMTLEYKIAGGCVGRCSAYRVVVRGSGVVEYEDLGGEPRSANRRRAIPPDEVVSILNEFVRARFFEAAASYTTEPVARRQGEAVRFLVRGGWDGPEWDLTLRVGTQTKSVHLYMGFPAELAKLTDLLESVGGPGAWGGK